MTRFSVIDSRDLWEAKPPSDWAGRPYLVQSGPFWLCCYRTAAKHTPNGETEFHIRVSADEGRTWSAEDLGIVGMPIVPSEQTASLTTPAMTRTPSGDLLLWVHEVDIGFIPGQSPARYMYGCRQYRSVDGGSSWADEEIILDDAGYGPMQQVAIVGTDMYGVIWYDPDGVYDYYKPSETLVLVSSDNGMSWQFHSVITHAGVNTNEAGICYLGGGKLLSVIRSKNQDRTWVAWCDLPSNEWRVQLAPELGVFQKPKLKPDPNVPGRVWALGRHAEYYESDVMTRRSHCALHYSNDIGKTWNGPFGPNQRDNTKGSSDAGYNDFLWRQNGDIYVIDYWGTEGSAKIVDYVCRSG